MPTWLEWVLHGDAWVSLLTLTILEIVLGLDNLIFISIVCGKLPAHEQAKTRNTGLALALITRIMLLCSITWIMSLAQEWWPAEVWGIPVPNSGKDLILFAGGLFLIWNSVNEIHHRLEGDQEEHADVAAPSVRAVIGRIIVLDIIFSLDSVITAVGMANQLPVMILAVVLAMVVMIGFAGYIGKFVNQHPSIKMLALAFLIAIGFTLLSESLHQHIDKRYVYFAMAFAAAVEGLNLRAKSKSSKGKPNS